MNIKYSDALRKLYGYTDEEDAPNTWDMWLKGAHPDDVKFVEDSYMAALRDRTGNTNYDVTYRAVKKDGTLHWYRAVGYTIRREDGSAEFCYGYIMDINEQKEASDMLEEALEQARKNIKFVTDAAKSAEIGYGSGYEKTGKIYTFFACKNYIVSIYRIYRRQLLGNVECYKKQCVQ